MKTNHIVSVCVPTYNGQEYLRACIDSVLVQTFTKFELLIVDDCSSDDTLRIANSYSERDPRVRVVANESNLGLVGNWNRCIELSKGDWIRFVFQDDLIEPDCLEKMMAVADVEHPFILCRRDFIYEDTDDDIREKYNRFLNEWSMEAYFPEKKDIKPDDIVTVQLGIGLDVQINYFGEPTSALLHKSLFERFGYFNSALVQICDLEFWLRVGLNVGVRYVPETLVHFRVHGGSTTSRNREGREFRAHELDWLVLLHEYLYNPFFSKLRLADKKRDQFLSRKLLAEKARWFHGVARRMSATAGVSGTTPVEEWESLLMSYPKISGSLYFKWLTLLEELDRRVFYRFKK